MKMHPSITEDRIIELLESSIDYPDVCIACGGRSTKSSLTHASTLARTVIAQLYTVPKKSFFYSETKESKMNTQTHTDLVTLARKPSGMRLVDSARVLAKMQLPTVSLREIFAMDLKTAHNKLEGYFAHLFNTQTGKPVACWQSVRGMLGALLTTEEGQDKLAKPGKIPTRNVGLSLSPSVESGILNACQFATRACKAACIAHAGQNGFTYAQSVRIAKTRALHGEPVAFLRVLFACLMKEAHRARKKGKVLSVRLNILSDIPWEAMVPGLFDFFGGWGARFYDYTKQPDRQLPENYSLTFSRTGHNDRHCDREIAKGRGVACVYDDENGKHLPPKTWKGRPVIDGDKHDQRWQDPAGCYVFLRFKHPIKDRFAIKASSGAFVLRFINGEWS